MIKNSLKKKVGLGFLVSKRTNKTFNQYKLKKYLYKIFQTISHKIKLQSINRQTNTDLNSLTTLMIYQKNFSQKLILVSKHQLKSNE
jgi:hypothetical protein